MQIMEYKNTVMFRTKNKDGLNNIEKMAEDRIGGIYEFEVR